MCKPASFIVSRRKIWWHPTSDAHKDIISKYKLHIDGARGVNAVPVEISPSDGDLSRPLDEWTFRADIEGYMRDLPDWWDANREERRCRVALEDWAKARLTGWRLFEAFHPFNPFAGPPQPMPPEHVRELVLDWASVGASVGASVWDSAWDSAWNSVWASAWDSVRNSVWASVLDSVWASVRNSVLASVGASVRNSVRDSVRASVRNSVRGYIGSLFPNITEWHGLPGQPHPWDSLRELWLSGRVPSYDGKIWRVHVGPDARVEMVIPA